MDHDLANRKPFWLGSIAGQWLIDGTRTGSSIGEVLLLWKEAEQAQKNG